MNHKITAWLLSLFALSSCSGGGGSSPAPAPTTPPVAAAPTISIAVDKSVVDEGQPFTIDASATTDPNGDTVTFSITQTAGPVLQQISGTSSAVFSFETPRLDVDTVVSFTVTASDGSQSSDQSVSVTIQNIVRTPLTDQWTDLLDSQSVGVDVNQLFSGTSNQDGSSFGVPAKALALSQNAQFGDDRVHELEFASDGTFTVGPGLQLPAFSGPDPDDLIYVFDDLNLDTRLDIVQYDPVSGLLAFYENIDDSGSTLLTTIASLTTPNVNSTPVACDASTTRIGNDRPGTFINEFPGLLIGTIGNGLRGVLNSGNPRTDPASQTVGFSTEATFTTSGSFCGFALSSLNPGGFNEVYSYDPDRQEVVPIDLPVTLPPSIGQAIPLTLPVAGLRLVDLKSGIGQGGQAFLALLLTEGVHEGTHLIAVLQLENGSFTQTTLTLPNGVPSELLVTSIDAIGTSNISEFDSDLVVVVPETPYIYVFENLSQQDGSTVSFAPITFFEAGFDVANITLLDATQSFGPELVTGSTDGTVAVYRNTEG